MSGELEHYICNDLMVLLMESVATNIQGYFRTHLIFTLKKMVTKIGLAISNPLYTISLEKMVYTICCKRI